MDYETLRYETDDHVTVLTYARPEQRNAVNRRMNEELHHAWRRFRDDPDAFVLVITGEGEAFCAGWDLEDAAELGEGPRPDSRTPSSPTSGSPPRTRFSGRSSGAGTSSAATG